MSKLCVIGDLHLGNNKDNPAFHKIALDYATWLNTELAQRSIERIVFLGDIFHSRTTISLPTINTANAFFKILEAYQIDIITGNHDCWFLDNSEVHSLALFQNWPNITIHDEVAVRDNLAFVPWGTSLDKIPPADVVFGHFDIVGFEMNKNKISSHGFKGTDLMEQCKLCLTGHYHRAQTRTYSGKNLMYTGSAFQLNWGESGNDNFVYILDTETLEVIKFYNRISPRFEYIRNTSDFNKIEGNFVAVQIKDNKAGAELVLRVESLSPLGIKTQIQEEENFTLTTDVKEFKVVDIELVINEFVSNLENFSEEQKAEILNLSVQLYKKYT